MRKGELRMRRRSSGRWRRRAAEWGQRSSVSSCTDIRLCHIRWDKRDQRNASTPCVNANRPMYVSGSRGELWEDMDRLKYHSVHRADRVYSLNCLLTGSIHIHKRSFIWSNLTSLMQGLYRIETCLIYVLLGLGYPSWMHFGILKLILAEVNPI